MPECTAVRTPLSSISSTFGDYDDCFFLASIRAGHSAGVLSAMDGVTDWVEFQFQLLLAGRAGYHLTTVKPRNGADVQVGGTGEGGHLTHNDNTASFNLQTYC